MAVGGILGWPDDVLLATMAGHQAPVRGTSLLRDGRRALSWSEDATLRLWDIETGVCLHELKGHRARVNGAWAFDGDRRVLSWSDDGTLRIWDVATCACEQ